jgi:Bacterial Ig-like domain
VPVAASSPFGLDERQAFKVVSGGLDLTFVPGQRAVGTYDFAMRNTASEPPPGFAAFSFKGSFALDLVAARRDGVIRYEGCEPAELAIEETSPDNGEQQVYNLRPPVGVRFNLPVDPASIDADRFQLTYPDPATAEPVAVAARLLRDRATAWLVPETDLETGVRYTARVKTGDDGVRGAGGARLPDPDGGGWYRWTFATRLDFEPRGEGRPLLACNLYQTARDAPLLAGKPAVARVYADWSGAASVHPSAQVEEFDARVVLWDSQRREVASTYHHFVRPDLWKQRGIDTAKAEHTAQIYGWSPASAAGAYQVALEIETKPGKRVLRYFASCPTKLWDYAPVLTIDYFAMVVGEWEENPAELEATLPVLQRLIAAAQENAVQLFPIAAIEGGPLKVVELEGDQRPPPGCGSACFLGGVRSQLQAASHADIVVGFAPQEVLGGGSTGPRLPSGQAVLVSLAGRSEAWFPRYVDALVHEIGHALDLEHIPQVSESERQRATALRDAALLGGSPLRYQGIEGFRLTADGGAGWNKSAAEGNEQGDWLAPLMYPTTIPVDEAFIANHHYRAIQRTFEKLHWARNRAPSE